ncbi:hypothetical protein QBC37DRAFT_374102 [Rhypophila decipiens]|uniref:Dirigent protein n=1 Tax=Rhypophila decipiens TaxID=261697 RepID=A0AAN6Y8R3_9PEZI|nr:hypothetical protein QBC37DRAFT_374102 [Rhypophila decipiens]
MHFFSLLTVATGLLGQAVTGAAQSLKDNPVPPGVQFLFSGNISVGLPVDIGAVPAGNVTVIPVIGGAVSGPKIAGKMLALGADWSLSTQNGYSYSDMRAHIRAMDNSNIYLQMSGVMQGANGIILVRGTFQTGSKDFWWMNYAFAFGVMKPSPTGFTVDMWHMTYGMQ